MQKKDDILGTVIRTARMQKGYTQEALSELLDITPGHLQHIESGRRNPSVSMLASMMRLLDFSFDAVVFSAGKVPPSDLLEGIPEKQTEALVKLIHTMKTK